MTDAGNPSSTVPPPPSVFSHVITPVRAAMSMVRNAPPRPIAAPHPITPTNAGQICDGRRISTAASSEIRKNTSTRAAEIPPRVDSSVVIDAPVMSGTRADLAASGIRPRVLTSPSAPAAAAHLGKSCAQDTAPKMPWLRTSPATPMTPAAISRPGMPPATSPPTNAVPPRVTYSIFTAAVRVFPPTATAVHPSSGACCPGLAAASSGRSSPSAGTPTPGSSSVIAMSWFRMITLAFQVRHAAIAAVSASVAPFPAGQRRNAAVRQNGLFWSVQ